MSKFPNSNETIHWTSPTSVSTFGSFWFRFEAFASFDLWELNVGEASDVICDWVTWATRVTSVT